MDTNRGGTKRVPAVGDDAEAALFNGLFRETRDGILVADTTGTILRVNPAACERLGVTEDAIEGKITVFDLVAPEDEPRTRALFGEALAGTSPRDILTIQGSDGARYLVESRKTRVDTAQGPLVVIVTRDVTERERERARLNAIVDAHRALARARSAKQAAEEILRTFRPQFPWSLAAVFVEDAGTRRLRLLACIGHDSEKVTVLEEDLDDPRHESFLIGRAYANPGTLQTAHLKEARIPAPLEAELAEKGLRVGLATTLHTMEGSPFGVIFTGFTQDLPQETGILNPSSELADWMRVVSEEVSAALDRGRKREILESTLEHQRRLTAEISAFAYRASHDLSEPLRGISTLATYAREEIDRGDLHAARDVLARIAEGSERLKTLIASYLEMSRVRATERPKAVWRLVDALRNASDELTVCLREHNGRLLIENPMPEVAASRGAVHAALVHLVTTAIHTSDQPSPLVCVTARERTDGWVEVSVRSDGHGFPIRDLSRLFDVFNVSRSEGHEAIDDATLAGLAIARHAVEAEGGRLWAEEAPDGGTDFRFTLPAAHRHVDFAT